MKLIKEATGPSLTYLPLCSLEPVKGTPGETSDERLGVDRFATYALTFSRKPSSNPCLDPPRMVTAGIFSTAESTAVVCDRLRTPPPCTMWSYCAHSQVCSLVFALNNFDWCALRACISWHARTIRHRCKKSVQYATHRYVSKSPSAYTLAAPVPADQCT